jgi:hypothetical protein
VAPDGSDSQVHWVEHNRQWDPYQADWAVASIPALDPESSGRGSEDAQDMLKAILSGADCATAQERYESGKIGWLDLAEELAPIAWAAGQTEAVMYLADEWLAALNGHSTDPEVGGDEVWGRGCDGESLAPGGLEFEFA